MFDGPNADGGTAARAPAPGVPRLVREHLPARAGIDVSESTQHDEGCRHASEQLRAVTDRLDWAWQDPPATGFVPPIRRDARVKEPDVSALPHQPDLVVLSHLRWEWVWQRPQHLVSRWAKLRAAAGARTWFVEEPEAGDVTTPELRHDEIDGIHRVWLVVPTPPGQPKALGFDADDTEEYGTMVADLLAEAGSPRQPDVLLYTPMALDIALELSPGRLMYDVMDDLGSFLKAPQGLQLRQRRLLAEADVVFTGGRSLHAGVSQHRTTRCHLFPSGVETSHYATSRSLREQHDRKVAGYVGVIDERIDLELVAALAAALPEWTIRIVGPVAKIEESDLPQAANLEYHGMTAYGELPRVMAGFDVALMPFALNEATRSISPTKTLEYLAAGLPVVSTRVADVVTDYSGVVHFADDAAEFAAACQEVVEHSRAERDRRLRPIQERQEWDYIASSMAALMVEDATGPAVIDLTVRGEVTA